MSEFNLEVQLLTSWAGVSCRQIALETGINPQPSIALET